LEPKLVSARPRLVEFLRDAEHGSERKKISLDQVVPRTASDHIRARIWPARILPIEADVYRWARCPSVNARKRRQLLPVLERKLERDRIPCSARPQAGEKIAE